MAVNRPSGQLSHEDVVKQLTELTVAYDTGLSIRGDFADLLHVTFKVEKETYEDAIAWRVCLLNPWTSTDLRSIGTGCGICSKTAYLPRTGERTAIRCGAYTDFT